ncbi:hypothetical protein CF165_26925 [Amycolatopsis vastitatis]|uniref:Uncharacterized protein n=1 Tax=Amycolatopsis vastitatis TaxID=1905142 RepID=A0A229SZE1_9PSEU|nr:hypothetical protein CF165_26925 [Amycolatopsis vastitatis]
MEDTEESQAETDADTLAARTIREHERRAYHSTHDEERVRAQSHHGTAVGKFTQTAREITNQTTYYGLERGNQAASGSLPEPYVKQKQATHSPPEEFERLLDILDEHRIAYVMGGKDTGRFTSACVALANRVGAGKVLSIAPGGGTSLPEIVDTPSVVEDGCGHVLELSSAESVTKQALAAVGGRLKTHEAYLVVIGPPARMVDSGLGDYAVGHSTPDARDVLERHLTQLIDDTYSKKCLESPALAEYLGTSPLPGEVRHLAVQLAEGRAKGAKPEEALDKLASRLRKHADDLLRVTKEAPAKAIEVRAHLRKLAFRIAYVLFHGNQLTVVSEVASSLYVALSPPGRPAPTSSLFDGGLESLLGGTTVLSPAGETGSEGRRSRAAGGNPALAEAVLSVVWSDYDQVRDRLLPWLLFLGGSPQDRIRIRAAYTAGRLLTYDFTYVYRNLVRGWALSPKLAHRQSAALAMEFAKDDPELTDRVRRQVRDWAYSESPRMRDAAARAYGTTLGRLLHTDALLHLRFIAENVVQTSSLAVPAAIAEIYQPETRDAVLAELGSWAESNQRAIKVQAARSMLLLARFDAVEDETWPALLHQNHYGDQSEDPLRNIWRTALSDPVTARTAWRTIAEWLVRADGRGELEDVTLAFASRILSEPPMRNRALWVCRNVWRENYQNLTIWDRLSAEIKKG